MAQNGQLFEALGIPTRETTPFATNELGGESGLPVRGDKPMKLKPEPNFENSMLTSQVEPSSEDARGTEFAAAQSGQDCRELRHQFKVDGTQGKAVVKEFVWPINPNLPPEEIAELTKYT